MTRLLRRPRTPTGRFLARPRSHEKLSALTPIPKSHPQHPSITVENEPQRDCVVPCRNSPPSNRQRSPSCSDRGLLPVVAEDPYLEPLAAEVLDRYRKYYSVKADIELIEGSLPKFSLGYRRFGFNRVEGGFIYREWLPQALNAFLTGDFNNWNRTSHKLNYTTNGIFSIFLPDNADGSPMIPHKSKVKLAVTDTYGRTFDRIPAWIRMTTQDIGKPYLEGIMWNPVQPYIWRYARPSRNSAPRIYEAHIGMSSNDAKVATYKHFTKNILPKIKKGGYNCVQLMGIMEHSYYASYGYLVTNFFSISSRFGTPEDLKELIDEAHGMGLSVILDVVHSHASSNSIDGLNMMDGTDSAYFVPGSRGVHPNWKSRLFNYGDIEVIRFLLSNLRFYYEEYHFDGFRFDSITSMIYKDHGLSMEFSGNYSDYEAKKLDENAIIYLMLANTMLHSIDSSIITIAEDVSGFPTLCRPVHLGGIGFDYRLSMSIPDMWVSLIETVDEREWSIQDIMNHLSNRRADEKTINYVECHDQSLGQERPLAYRLMGSSMGNGMNRFSCDASVCDRGIALLKIIRLLTYSVASNGYLNFMGNEFGHPDWVEFPSGENNESYLRARRRWDLVENKSLKYQYLNRFDTIMNGLDATFHILSSDRFQVLLLDDNRSLVVFLRGSLLFAFNFNPSLQQSVELGVYEPGQYIPLLETDSKLFGGSGFCITDAINTAPCSLHDKPNTLKFPIPARSAIVMCPASAYSSGDYGACHIM